jgi:hypothetical protein
VLLPLPLPFAQVLASAKVTPINGPQATSPPTAQNQLNMEVSNCPGKTAAAAGKLLVELSPPVATSNATYAWKIISSALGQQPQTINYKDSGALQFNISWVKVETVTGVLMGNVTVTNPTQAPINMSAVTIQPEMSRSSGVNTGAVPEVAAACTSMQLQPGESTTCTYSVFINSGGSGTVQAEVAIADGTVALSAATLFTFAAANGSDPAAATACADVTYGLMLGSLLQLPGAAGPISYNSTKACADGGVIVTQPIGPFKDDQCGKYTVSAAASAADLLYFVGMQGHSIHYCDCSMSSYTEDMHNHPAVLQFCSGLHSYNAIQYYLQD